MFRHLIYAQCFCYFPLSVFFKSYQQGKLGSPGMRACSNSPIPLQTGCLDSYSYEQKRDKGIHFPYPSRH